MSFNLKNDIKRKLKKKFFTGIFGQLMQWLNHHQPFITIHKFKQKQFRWLSAVS